MTSVSPPAPRKSWPSRAVVVMASAALVAALIAPRPGHAQGQGAGPVKKDSSPRAKSKNADLTTSLSPAEARPGATVVYKVTARLKPGFHIYSHAREQAGEGPRNTRFDLFDADGLTVAGDWTPSRAPTREKDPMFKNLEFVESYEDEVTWSLPLTVPADAAPGKKTIRCQASYQVCDASSCSLAGQWTLPDVTLTVLGGGGGGDRASGPSPAPGPKKPDGSERMKPKAVALKATVAPAEARPGDTVAYSVTATIEPGWHVYDYARNPTEDGAYSTRFDFFDAGGLKPEGDWTSKTAPRVEQDAAFNVPVAFFEKEATWTLRLRVPEGLAPGAKRLRCQADYQVCNASQCVPHFRATLPDVVLTVLPAGSSAPTARAEASKPAPTAPEAARESKPEEEKGKNKDKAVSDVEKTAARGIVPLMIASALGGLLALAMPCVWPMVPITVNFFVKQGQSQNGNTTALAVTYCLAIIGVFTAVGVLCSFFVSATALPRLANNPWLNFAVAGLFLAFGLSLLGLFEVRLPNALLNASAKGESRGGLAGVVFMALTLTITSFTCTFPVVGGLLVMASAGEVFSPILGLATFSTVLALPFFLLALSPGLLSKMPRSGDWMNAVKVVGGLVEIGAALKFVNTAELAWTTPEHAWVNAQFVLTAWVILAAVCGFYLLGFFRTDHDHEDVRVGPGRMVIGSTFLGIALFLAPALFGREPRSPIWDLFVGLMPPDVSSLFPSPSAPGTVGPSESHATAADPELAQRQETRFHGVLWGFSYEQALEKARAENKPVLIDFTGVNCANCRTMEQTVLPRPEVVSLLRQFVTVELFTDFVPISSITADQREELARKNAERLIDLTNANTNPYYVILAPDGKVLGAKGDAVSEARFVEYLKGTLAKFKGEGKMVQAEPTR